MKSSTSDANKTKALDLAIANIEKQYGKGSIMKLGDGKKAKGRIVEIYGPESSGKTTLALSTIAEAQKIGGSVAFVDAEHALDITYAEKLGVKVEDMLVSQPDTGEQALEITEALVRSSAVDVLVIDSVAALTPRAEIEGDMGDSHMGLQARLMSQALRKLAGIISRSNTLVIFINQIRMKIGVMFGNPETTTGGNALKFYASVRLDVRRIGAIKNGDEIVGNKTAVKVVKNKLAPPFARVEFELMYGEGISYEGDLIELGVKKEIIDKAGAWYSYQGAKLGQGKEASKKHLKENPALRDEISKKVKIAYGILKDDSAPAKQAKSETATPETATPEAPAKATKQAAEAKSKK